MSKKITSFLVLLAVMLLTLPSHAQVQKAKRTSSGKAVMEMRNTTPPKALNVDRAQITFAKATLAKQADAAVEGTAFPQWNWAAHAPKQYVPQSGLSQMSSATAKTAVVKTEEFSGVIGTSVKKNLHVQKLTSMLNLNQHQKFEGKKVLGMRKADANATIEGMWTFQLGDYYFQTSVGQMTCNFEATLNGTEVLFEDPNGNEQSFFAEYDEVAGTLTFNRKYVGMTYGYYIYQEPYVYNYDTENLDVQSITGIYSAAAGTITFEPDNGISWHAYSNAAGTGDSPGYVSIYDLEGATIYVAPELVEAPVGLVTEEYSIKARNYANDADVNGSVFIGFDDNDVYIKGISTVQKESWIKGTLNGTTITFAAGQYLGVYNSQDWFFNKIFGEDVVFTYDETAGKLTAQNEVFMVDNGGTSYIPTSSYRNAIFTKIIEKPATPAAPTITSLENTTWGYMIRFNIPTVDTEGDGLVTSKLSYQLFTDVETDINPLVFTPATHVELTENMTVIPYGFTDGYDFYATNIYLNDLYSSSWNKIGIKSIYTGGDETHESEIQWYTIKKYYEPIAVPYTADFTVAGSFDDFTVLDNNGDGSTWAWSASNYAYYRWNTSNAADDYLILPIELEANKNYSVTVNAAAQGSSMPEKFEVKVGKAATAADLTTTVISETTVNNTNFTDYEGEFTTDEAGTWYVAIHCTSDADQYYLKVKSLTIELGADPAAPAAPADFTAAAGEKGALEVNISLTAPATSIGNSELTGTENVVIYRDDAAVKTFEGVTAGTALTWQDTDVKDGVSYTYYAQASNESGLGAKSEKVSVWVGQDMPEDIENIQVTGMPTANSVSFTWDAVKGVNGGYIDAANAQYSVTTIEIEEVEILPGWSWEMPVEGETLGTVTGDTKLTVDFAGLDEGELGIQYFGVKAKVGENETDPTSWMAFVYTGAPYELPIEENFADQSFNYLWDYNEVTRFMVSTDASDGDGVALAFTADGADGTVMMESFKLNTKAAANPTLLFDTKKGTSATDKLIVYGLAPDGTKTTLQTVTLTDEYQTVKVVIPAELAKERWAKIGFNADLENGKYILLDNIKILDLYEYDLSMAVSAPASVQAGNKATITATVKNEGENAATGYTVKITAGNEILMETAVDQILEPFTTATHTTELETTIFDDAADLNIVATVIYDNDLNPDNDTAETIISIKESTATPVASVTAEADGSSVLVGWTAPNLDESSTEEVIDDVESYAEFDNGGLDADNLNEHYGQIGEWTVYDGNREYGYGFNNITVPHLGEPNAWLVMNVSSDQLSQDLSESQPAYSGKQYFISTCVAESEPIVDTDHWLISPELPGTAQHISFMARELTDQYGEESFQIWYSTTDNKIESFQQHEYGFGLVVLETWDKFEYDLPEGTKYFAIRHTSNDIFGLCIDDIQFTTGATPLEIDHFNIYLDGESVATADADAVTATLEDVANGDHAVAVSVVYTNGQESKPVETTVHVSSATGIQNITVVTKPVDVYSVEGKLVRQQTTSLSGLKGVYIVDGKKVVIK